ncbi:hypothetical protein ASPWEDRAFT_26516 [Aspergillus wentii DTO 134E9]|uniref:Cofilin n=1 Tax=Aspergillus wentii DTO 134E9 TaxID=1073089 RepID=A0A1L9RQ94_ASPWE|nr:uncharacterized protein ASPWEDRAFT_26516 [Aspergillus wentii DTO 134E9]OJJ37101.1 hypothetical protein ASPWEDRAFT_26516 [Aspergillus wentii DTO 134E9]
MSGNKPEGQRLKFIIFKVSDDQKTIEIEEASTDPNYETFRNKLAEVKEANGKPAPRYAVYDVEYEHEGKRNKIVFISWVPSGCNIRSSMIYASSREGFKTALNVSNSIQADDKDEIEWKNIVSEASGGKVKA